MNTRPGDLRSTREGLGRARSARVLLSLKRLALVDDVTKLLLPLKWVSVAVTTAINAPCAAISWKYLSPTNRSIAVTCQSSDFNTATSPAEDFSRIIVT